MAWMKENDGNGKEKELGGDNGFSKGKEPSVSSAGGATVSVNRKSDVKEDICYANILRSRNKFADSLVLYERVLESDGGNVEALIGKGICLQMQNTGRLAFDSFSEAIKLDPQNACALTHCGILYKEEGRLMEAAESYQKALRVDPTYKAAAECLAIVLTDIGTNIKLAGNTQEGIQKYFEALKVDPHYAPAYYNLGVVYSEMMQYDMALTFYEKASSERPMYAEAYCNMGVIYKNRGDLEAAITCYERCLAVSPNFEIAKNNMAIALTDLGTKVKLEGDINRGVAFYKKALFYNWHYADAMYNLGVAYGEMLKFDMAIVFYELAFHFNPHCAEACNNLGVIYKDRDNLDKAVECYQLALSIKPNFSQSLNNLGVVYTVQGKMDAAASMIEKAIIANPTYAEAYNNLGVLYRDAGDIALAINAYEQCLKIDPDSRNAGQNRLLAMNYIDEGNDDKLFEAHRDWGRRFMRLYQPFTSWNNSKDPERPLVIGYVSPDYFTHSVSYFIEAPLIYHNYAKYKVIVYSAVVKADSKTIRFREKVLKKGGIWKEIYGTDEKKVADIIKEDQVDILVELTGHTAIKSLFSLFNLITLLLCCSSFTTSSSQSSQQFIKDNETVSSNSGNFTLGFFTPQNSTNRYVGIWSKTQDLVIWVANRNQPLINDSSGVLTISNDGNLVVLNGQKHVIWSSSLTNVTSKTNSSFTLSDYGNLVLSETTTGKTIWESFQHPSNALLASMDFTSNMKLTSWKNLSNPSTGSFSLSIERLKIPEVFIWNGTRPYWRSGPWNNQIFIGIQDMGTLYLNGFHFEKDRTTGSVHLSFRADDFGLLIYALNPQGQMHENSWSIEEEKWIDTWTSYRSDCDVYGFCGPFGVCNSEGSQICSCLEEFEPRNQQEWNQKNWTNGCVRKKPLQCENAKNQSNSSQGNEADSFMKLRMVKVPDFAEFSSDEQDECKNKCLMNCSCTAYSYVDNIGCMSWNGNLIDLQQFQTGETELYIRVPYVELNISDKGHKGTIIIAVSVSIVSIGSILIVIVAYFICIKASKPDSERKKKHHRIFHFHKIEKPEEHSSEHVIGELSQAKLQELLLYKFDKLATATNNFHSSNKLGQGGFGPVYKGILEDGKEIAVKRLSISSGQGLKEFLNEVVVISKLQHRNLVRLLGCCTERNEKMLMYEFMPNGSLDAYIFDPSRNKLLDWEKRFSIIEGIARGLLYLHRDSRLKIIHRDLKASNILLDEEMNPKISDFGMARIFGVSEDHANTQRIVGTYGYMAPEYAMQGVFSDKSDVFSFGVLLIEIVCGRRNSSFYEHENSLTLLGFAWTQWREGNILCLIEPEIYDESHDKDILRCIHIGLLCVQESAVDRPTMATVISMLNSEIMELPPARQPAFLLMQNMINTVYSEERNEVYSNNVVSITDLHGR